MKRLRVIDKDSIPGKLYIQLIIILIMSVFMWVIVESSSEYGVTHYFEISLIVLIIFVMASGFLKNLKRFKCTGSSAFVLKDKLVILEKRRVVFEISGEFRIRKRHSKFLKKDDFYNLYKYKDFIYLDYNNAS